MVQNFYFIYNDSREIIRSNIITSCDSMTSNITVFYNKKITEFCKVTIYCNIIVFCILPDCNRKRNYFYAPTLKFQGSSNRPIPFFFRPPICQFVHNSILLTKKVHYLKFKWWYSNQTWTMMSKNVKPKDLTNKISLTDWQAWQKKLTFPMHILLFELTRFSKSVQMTGMSKKISTSLLEL